jgi:hypothetical protein
MESVLEIDVSNPKFIGYIADELRKRLEGKVKAEVQADKRVAVVAQAESESQFPAIRKIVQDELNGVLQLLALDPLDQGKVTARIR